MLVSASLTVQRSKKGFNDAVEAAKTEIANGNLERARTEYVNALRFKPNNPEILEELNKLNLQLGITPAQQAGDTLVTT